MKKRHEAAEIAIRPRDGWTAPAAAFIRRLLIGAATRGLIVIGVAICLVNPVIAQTKDIAERHVSDTDLLYLKPIRTESPRATLGSALRIRDDLETAHGRYRRDRTRALSEHIELLASQLAALIDLSAVPRATRRERGTETAMYLLDILGRIDLPALHDVPAIDDISDETEAVSWRIPNSPLRIIRIDEGPRADEFLFNQRTLIAAPRFFRGIEEVPLRSQPGFESWSEMARETTGPLIPVWLIDAVPDSLHWIWLDTPAWKVLLVASLGAAILIIAAATYVILRRIETESRLRRSLLRIIVPIAVLGAIELMVPIAAQQINLSGRASDLEDSFRTVVSYLAWAWLFWLAVRSFFEWIISSPRISEESLDANMLRLISGIVGTIGVFVILAFGGQKLGLPVLSMLAGLGIGGLAVALAIRPTLENLIGGFVLYIDRPVKVGDFCSFGGERGTVERIGIRSTQLRALDRTLITVPNAQFADMQLVNWARCDQMLINETIGVRYETKPDQLRYLLTIIREMLHGHPRIDPNTVRVRFSGYGASSLNIGIRIYAMTREWNDFHAIREDVFLRIYDLVDEAGTSFAFPSQTLYMGRDDGLDESAGDVAIKKVESWRRSGRLPFPRMPEERLEALEGTLDYPPKGSHEAGGEHLDAIGSAERLSDEPADQDGADTDADTDADADADADAVENESKRPVA